MKYRWASRGARQSTIDLWTRKPVKVRGDWKDARGPNSPKGYYSFETVTMEIAKSFRIPIPEPGQVVRLS